VQNIKEITEKVNTLEKTIESIFNKINTIQEASFDCEYCEYKSKSEKKLNQHVKKNHKNLNATLEDDCCKENKDEINKLKKIVNELREKVNIESDADDSIEESLENIIRRNSRAVECDHCEFQCDSSKALKLHIKNDHKGEVWYPCRQCGMDNDDFAFSTKNHQNMHKEQVHTKGHLPLTDVEFDTLDEDVLSHIEEGPNTPRKEDYQNRLRKRDQLNKK
jgi:hypothetical protein